MRAYYAHARARAHDLHAKVPCGRPCARQRTHRLAAAVEPFRKLREKSFRWAHVMPPGRANVPLGVGMLAGRVPVGLSRRARRARRSYSPQSVTAKMHRPAESDTTMAETAGSVRPPRSPLQPLRFAHSVRRREKAAARAGKASTCRSRRDSRPCLGCLGCHRARYCRSLRAHRSGRPCPAIKPIALVARMRPDLRCARAHGSEWRTVEFDRKSGEREMCEPIRARIKHAPMQSPERVR